ncbi:MAG: hypothetical protein JWM11_3014 [Planctomycetaceae bacterium]|nr:hypothetical protein [Planctomycetaceae bacterium]
MEHDEDDLEESPEIHKITMDRIIALTGGEPHVPLLTVAPDEPYGYCPECGGLVMIHSIEAGGSDTCVNGHEYPTCEAVFPEENEEHSDT